MVCLEIQIDVPGRFENAPKAGPLRKERAGFSGEGVRVIPDGVIDRRE
jgi:hypothetical protein